MADGDKPLTTTLAEPSDGVDAGEDAGAKGDGAVRLTTTTHDGAPAALPLRDDDLGAKLGRYTLLDRAGAGGMGVVFRARDPDLARDLAIKVVRAPSGSETQRRALREAQAMARLRAPGVVPVFDVGILDGGVYIVMPYLRGGTLRTWLRASRRPWREVLDRFIAAGHGLAQAHAAGLVHRDFKPDNVLLDDDGTPLVADLGLAHAIQRAEPVAGDPVPASLEATRGGATAGTLAYMAPEQLRGEPVDARADVFGFCVSLHEGLYGVRPFATRASGDAFEDQLVAIITGRVIDPPADREVPGWLRAVVMRGLEPELSARWPSIDAVLAQLERGRRGRRRALLLVLPLVAVLVTLAILLATRDHAGPPPPRTYRHVRLTARGDLSSAALAPDGHHLAVASMAGDLVVRDLDGADEERVIASNALVPAWSSDAARIVYVAGNSSAHAIDLASGVDTDLGESGGYTTVVGADVAIVWRINAKILTFVDLAHPDVAHWSCDVPGTYRWLKRVVPRSDGTLIVGVMAGTDEHVDVDRLVQLDTHCNVLHPIADGLALTAIANLAHDDRLVAETGTPPHLVEIDLDGVSRPLDTPIPDGRYQLLGVRPEGSLLEVETAPGWRLVRAGPDHPPEEVAAGAQSVTVAMAPSGDRFAVVESNSDGTGGALRIVQLASPKARGAPVETDALAVAWLPDGTLATLVRRGDDTALVVEDEHGQHRAEHAVPRPALTPEMVALGAGEVAYEREDWHTFIDVDLATGVSRLALDPTLGYTHNLSRSPVDGSLLVWWNRSPAIGGYRVTGTGADEWLQLPSSAEPMWSRTGDAILVVSRMPPRIDRVDPTTHAIAPYVADLGSRSSISQVAPAADRDLFVLLSDPNADVFATSPSR